MPPQLRFQTPDIFATRELTGEVIEEDLDAARTLHRQRIRTARAPLLEALDVEYMRLINGCRHQCMRCQEASAKRRTGGGGNRECRKHCGTEG